MFRGRRAHEPFDRFVAALDLPPVAVLGEVPAPCIRHEHRILPMIGVFGVLFASVDQRRRMPLVVAEMQFSISLITVLSLLEEPFRLRFLTRLHPLWHHV